MKLQALFRTHIKNTPKGAIVINDGAILCVLTKTVIKAVHLDMEKVHITTRVIKHMYDKRTAEEFDVLLRSVYQIVRYPDEIYQNRNGKRGDLGFVKKINEAKYFCSLEIDGTIFCVATAFRIGKESYLQNFTLLWSWRGGTPPS